MNLQTIVQNKFIQAFGVISAIAIVFWFITNNTVPVSVTNNTDTLEDDNKIHKVSSEVKDDNLDIVIEVNADNNNEEESENIGEI